MAAPLLRRLNRLDQALARPLTWVFLVGALAWGGAVAIAGSIQLVTGLVTDRIPVVLTGDSPVPADASGGTAELVHGSFDTATVTVSNLSALPQTLLALGAVTGILTTLVVSLAVAALCWKLLRRRPFDRSLSRMAITVGCVLVLGTIIGQGFGGLGRMMAAGELNDSRGAGFWPLATTVDLTPVVVGFVLFLVAIVFEAGQRLQRDTEGLV